MTKVTCGNSCPTYNQYLHHIATKCDQKDCETTRKLNKVLFTGEGSCTAVLHHIHNAKRDESNTRLCTRCNKEQSFVLLNQGVLRDLKVLLEDGDTCQQLDKTPGAKEFEELLNSSDFDSLSPELKGVLKEAHVAYEKEPSELDEEEQQDVEELSSQQTPTQAQLQQQGETKAPSEVDEEEQQDVEELSSLQTPTQAQLQQQDETKAPSEVDEEDLPDVKEHPTNAQLLQQLQSPQAPFHPDNKGGASQDGTQLKLQDLQFKRRDSTDSNSSNASSSVEENSNTIESLKRNTKTSESVTQSKGIMSYVTAGKAAKVALALLIVYEGAAYSGVVPLPSLFSVTGGYMPSMPSLPSMPDLAGTWKDFVDCVTKNASNISSVTPPPPVAPTLPPPVNNGTA